jgi:lactoylglutathione lyase
MRIEHLALWTEDLEALAAFYRDYFAARLGVEYVNAAKGFRSRFLSFESGARLEIMSTSTLAPLKAAPGAQRMGLAHFAVATGSEARVDELTRRLLEDGFKVLDGPRRTGDGYYESVVLDPDGNRIELTV